MPAERSPRMGIGGLNPEVEAEVSTRVYHYEDRIAELKAELAEVKTVLAELEPYAHTRSDLPVELSDRVCAALIGRES